MTEAIVLLSGGQDSTTVLFWAREKFNVVCCLAFDYGQRHRYELACAKQIALKCGHKFEILLLGSFGGITSTPLTDNRNKVEEYSSASDLPVGVANTFVPGRNLLFLTMAAAWGHSRGIRDLVIGVNALDYSGYPDCREDSIDAASVAIGRCLYADPQGITIHSPLVNYSKGDIVLVAENLGPKCWEAIGMTSTCYKGVFPPCGRCAACLLRAKGFADAGRDDPIFKSNRPVNDHLRG